jgi:lipoprotein LprG
MRTRTTPRPARASRPVVALVALLACLVALSGCTGSDSPKPTKTEQTPAQRLAAARTALEASPAVDFELTSAGLPAKAVGVSGAKGTGLFKPPSFKGTLNATIAGVTGTVEVIAVEQDVYLKFFTPGYNKINPSDYGAPNPAQLFNTQTGITSLIGKTSDAATGPQQRDRSDVLDTITGTVPGSAVADLFVIGDRSGTFDITYGITHDSKDLRTVVLKGPFYAGTTATYTLRLKALDQAVAITRP